MDTTVVLDSIIEPPETGSNAPAASGPVAQDRAGAAAHLALATGVPLLVIAGGPAAVRAALVRALAVDRLAAGADVLVAPLTGSASPHDRLAVYLDLPQTAAREDIERALGAYKAAETRLFALFDSAERLTDDGLLGLRRLREADPHAEALTVVLIGEDALAPLADRLLAQPLPGVLRFIRLAPHEADLPQAGSPKAGLPKAGLPHAAGLAQVAAGDAANAATLTAALPAAAAGAAAAHATPEAAAEPAVPLAETEGTADAEGMAEAAAAAPDASDPAHGAAGTARVPSIGERPEAAPAPEVEPEAEPEGAAAEAPVDAAGAAAWPADRPLGATERVHPADAPALLHTQIDDAESIIDLPLPQERPVITRPSGEWNSKQDSPAADWRHLPTAAAAEDDRGHDHPEADAAAGARMDDARPAGLDQPRSAGRQDSQARHHGAEPDTYQDAFAQLAAHDPPAEAQRIAAPTMLRRSEVMSAASDAAGTLEADGLAEPASHRPRMIIPLAGIAVLAALVGWFVIRAVIGTDTPSTPGLQAALSASPLQAPRPAMPPEPPAPAADTVPPLAAAPPSAPPPINVTRAEPPDRAPGPTNGEPAGGGSPEGTGQAADPRAVTSIPLAAPVPGPASATGALVPPARPLASQSPPGQSTASLAPTAPPAGPSVTMSSATAAASGPSPPSPSPPNSSAPTSSAPSATASAAPAETPSAPTSRATPPMQQAMMQLVAPLSASEAVSPPAGPGLLVIAKADDTLHSLYSRVYKGLQAPPFEMVASMNPHDIKLGDVVVFPAPPSGWRHLPTTAGR